MSTIRTVRLELLRPGPAHNQLLSPLTPYIALCGDASPTTLYIRHEHHRFLSRLERLRYATSQGDDLVAVPNRMREATVEELGSDVSDILRDIPSLLGEISRARETPAAAGDAGADRSVVHLSLVLGGSELALIPFELAVAPPAFPGEGLEMGLQLTAGTVMLREARRLLPPPPAWDGMTSPRLLLVAAAPAGLDIPLAAHVQAIREAFDPWIGWPRRQGGQDGNRLDEVRKHIHVLPDASIDAIYAACATGAFTHVHILAHGGAFAQAGEQQFGLVLCAEGDPRRAEVVSGRKLAKALRAETADGSRRAQPRVVTLATCDSGNTGSVLVPGGSLAHELHAEGIPWVFASQFPLTKTGSLQMAQALYPGLLRGDDPRRVLFELRRRLYLQGQGSHDWASVVAYASVPADFPRTVQSFFEHQSRRAIDVALARADDVDDPEQLGRSLEQAQEVLDRWRVGLPTGDTIPERERRAECYGIHGSTLKRMALIAYHRKDPRLGEQRLREALGHYRAAKREGAMIAKFHWVATQALSLEAALNEPADPDTFDLVWHVARLDLQNPDVAEQAWAHGTLAELEMIRVHHRARPSRSAAATQAAMQAASHAVTGHCRELLHLMGPQSFHVESTRRQFQRYVDYWDDRLKPIARAAVAALSVGLPSRGATPAG